MEQFIRSSALLSVEGINKLQNSKVVIFGLGGVGGYVLECLARTGVANFILIDNDVFQESNLNRQILATTDTINKSKVEVAKERILSINSSANVIAFNAFILKDNLCEEYFKDVDYIIDCIDTVTGKLSIIEKAKELDIPIISSMGTGNKLDPTKFKISTIEKSSVCPLAKVMRYELRKRNIKNVLCLYSDELPLKPIGLNSNNNKEIPGSVVFTVMIAGGLIARRVILDLINIEIAK